MSRVVRAKYNGGVLKPLDELDLSEGEIVSIIIEKKLPTGIADLVNKIRKNTHKTENPLGVRG